MASARVIGVGLCNQMSVVEINSGRVRQRVQMSLYLQPAAICMCMQLKTQKSGFVGV